MWTMERALESDEEHRQRLMDFYSQKPPGEMVGEEVSAGQIVEALRDRTRFGIRILASDKAMYNRRKKK